MTDYRTIAQMLDHALLRPTDTDAAMTAGCRAAREHGVATVCIKPYAVRLCAAILQGSDVLTSTVVGFPHGGHGTATKLHEIDDAIADGARELDVVVNIGKVLDEDWPFVEGEIAALTRRCHDGGCLIKVIFENCYLEDRHKLALCRVCSAAGVDFVKTSTGFGSGGATVADVRLMRAACPDAVRIKASGGIRTLADVLALREAGADRVGTSSSFPILAEWERQHGR